MNNLYKTELRLNDETKSKLDTINKYLQDKLQGNVVEVKITQADTVRYCIDQVWKALI